MNEVYTDLEKKCYGYEMTSEQIEEIRIKDFNNRVILWKCLDKGYPRDSVWKIWNCRFESVADAFFCSAYEYNLKEAITLAKKEFYGE